MLCRSMFTILAFLGFHLFGLYADGYKADLVIYSYDRPLQLCALLESVERYMTGVGEVHVIYRASNAEYARGYDMVQADFDYVVFSQQGDNPKQDFKPLTLKAAFESSNQYIIFAVDDIIVKDFINVSDDIGLLESTHAYGFYYRLGRHLSYCYTMNAAQAVPQLRHVVDDVYAWQLGNGQLDWGYPHTVDMTLYRKEDIQGFFKNSTYSNPNTLEASWASQTGHVRARQGLCYEMSKIVNLPLNRVQNVYANRHMDVSPKELLDIFMAGQRIDIEPLFRIANQSAHMEYELTFVERAEYLSA